MINTKINNSSDVFPNEGNIKNNLGTWILSSFGPESGWKMLGKFPSDSSLGVSSEEENAGRCRESLRRGEVEFVLQSISQNP